MFRQLSDRNVIVLDYEFIEIAFRFASISIRIVHNMHEKRIKQKANR